MLYGLVLLNGGVVPDKLSEFTTLTEFSGWDGIFLKDYIVWKKPPFRLDPYYSPEIQSGFEGLAPTPKEAEFTFSIAMSLPEIVEF